MSDSFAPIYSAPSENVFAQPRTILNSWKEIASYIGRGVRTVQRYEMRLGFPVHRPAGTSRCSVLAFSDEVEAWLRQTPVQSQFQCSDNVINTSPNTSKLPNGNHNGDTCPFCQGTGKVPAAAYVTTQAVNSNSAFSNNGTPPRSRGQQSIAKSFD